MAQIAENTRRHSKNKTIRKNLKVDLTPMVDLGFLLITFFILTTALSEPTIAKLIMPKDSDTTTTNVGAGAVLTLMLMRNDSIKYFEGSASDPELMKYCSFNSMRSVLQQKQKRVAEILGDKEKTVIIICPGNESTYKDFINVLDEIHINDIRHYFVVNESGRSELYK